METSKKEDEKNKEEKTSSIRVPLNARNHHHHHHQQQLPAVAAMPIVTHLSVGDTVYTQWSGVPWVECQVVAAVDGLYQVRPKLPQENSDGGDGGSSGSSGSSKDDGSATPTQWKSIVELISTAKGPARTVLPQNDYYIMTNGGAKKGIVLLVGKTLHYNKVDHTWVVDVVFRGNGGEQSTRRLSVSREFLFDMHADTPGGTFVLDNRLVKQAKQSAGLQSLVLLKDLLDSLRIPFWLSGSTAQRLKRSCRLWGGASVVEKGGKKGSEEAEEAEGSEEALIVIGIHKYDYMSVTVLTHLKHLFFEVDSPSSATLRSYTLTRSFYCSSMEVDDLSKDWRSAEDLFDCDGSQKMVNAMKVRLRLDVFEDNEETGMLVGGGGQYRYTKNMKLVWMDWMGRRFRVPNEKYTMS